MRYQQSQESNKRNRIHNEEIKDSNMDENRIFVDPKRQKKEQRGKSLTEKEEVELFRICKRHEKLYGRKGEKEGMAYFWNLVVSDFIDYRGNGSYSAKSCQRRITSKLMQRKLELQLEEKGKRRRCSDWTIAVDAWRDVVQAYETTEKEKKNQGLKVHKNFGLDTEGYSKIRGNSATMASKEDVDFHEKNDEGRNSDSDENVVDEFSQNKAEQSASELLAGSAMAKIRYFDLAKEKAKENTISTIGRSFLDSAFPSPQENESYSSTKKSQEMDAKLASVGNSVHTICKQNERIEKKLDELLAFIKR